MGLKRRRSSDGWDEFVEALQCKLESKFNFIYSMSVSQRRVELQYSTIENLPLAILGLFTFTIPHQISLEYSSANKCNIIIVTYDDGSKTSRLTPARPPMVRFPTQIITDLQLKNKDLHAHITKFTSDACNIYGDQMDWTTSMVPYKFVFQKKHKMMIVKLILKSKNVALHSIPPFSDSDCWVEYSAKLNHFSITKVFQDCV